MKRADSERVTLTNRDFIDLGVSREFWKFEARDRFGKWTHGNGSAAHEHTVRERTTSLRIEDAHSIRVFRTATRETRIKMLEDSGLSVKFRDRSEEDLLELASHPSAKIANKAEIRAELDRRIQALQTYAVALDQSITDEKRKEDTGWFKRWDAKLAGLPGGKHIIALRDKILSDGTLDKMDAVRAHVHEHGKEYATELATGLAMLFAFHPLGEAVAGMLANDAGKAAFEHLTDNLFVEPAILVAMSRYAAKVVNPLFHPISKEAKINRAKKVLAKQEQAAEAAMKLDREQRLRLSGHKVRA